MEQYLAGLEASGFAQGMRRSIWLYPSANVLHILGLMGFFAAVAAMDIVAIRRTDTAALRDFLSRIRPVAVIFLLLQIATGLMLFLPEASHIAHNPAFRAKLLLILIALANILVLEVSLSRVSRFSNSARQDPPCCRCVPCAVARRGDAGTSDRLFLIRGPDVTVRGVICIRRAWCETVIASLSGNSSHGEPAQRRHGAGRGEAERQAAGLVAEARTAACRSAAPPHWPCSRSRHPSSPAPRC